MACIDTTTLRSDGGNEDDAAPFLRLHMGYAELREDEGGAQVHADRVVELLQAHVQDAGPADPLPRVRDEDVRPRLAVLLRDLTEQLLDGLGRPRVDAVQADLAAAGGVVGPAVQLLDQGVNGLAVLEIRECQGGALGPQVPSTTGANPVPPSIKMGKKSGAFGPLGEVHTLLKHP